MLKLLVKLGLVMTLGGAAEAGSDMAGAARVPLSGGGGGGGSAGGGAILTAWKMVLIVSVRRAGVHLIRKVEAKTALKTRSTIPSRTERRSNSDGLMMR
jgi:hypothetical protein